MREGKTSIEERVHKRARRQRIQDVTLLSIYAIAATGMALLAPNAVQLLKSVEEYIGPNPKLRRRLSQSVTRLIERDLLERKKTRQGVRLELTAKGRDAASFLDSRQSAYALPKQKWDGKWRMVIFDVWEKRKGTRDQLRNKLRNIGFVMVQGSVWVYPYPCEELFAFLRADLKLGKGMLYIVAEEIENDSELREYFGLPLG